MARTTSQRRTLEPIQVRRERLQLEGREAMADYRRAEQRMRERTERLRAERLAREAKVT
jgi:hypothetical protein